MSLISSTISYTLPNGTTLVNSVSVSINPGELVCILGPNGAGKTTLLRLLSGELAATSGSVTLNGQMIHSVPSEQRARELAILPQSSHLSFAYPVIDVVLLGRLPHRKSSSNHKDRQIATDCLKALEVDHLAERSYPTLSGGEKQRVQLARILAQLDGGDDLTGKVLLLDEPTSALDLAHQHQVLQTAKQVAERGGAVLAILHDLNLAAQYGDQLIMMKNGEVAGRGSVEEVLKPCMIKDVYGVTAFVHDHPSTKCPYVSTVGRKEVCAVP